ncbi:hypothetical protein [Hymenobacter radiodurans]|uniref:hypothetical protein n=1 Tax=Hymenobacter radiodurans TaxID=2496028 RepID=UPI001058AAF5|nr:hypothetical protein [Hymenobacter radiodurans]
MLPSDELTLRSANGRLVLTADALEVDGQRFALLELDAVELKPIRWLLWFLLGALPWRALLWPSCRTGCAPCRPRWA